MSSPLKVGMPVKVLIDDIKMCPGIIIAEFKVVGYAAFIDEWCWWVEYNSDGDIRTNLFSAEKLLEWNNGTLPSEGICECGNKNNPVGQGHSWWCPAFRKEF